MILHAQQSGTGRPVVLLHGLFGQARNLGVVARALAATHRVIALDLRNHGDSPRSDAMDYPAMAADVRETLATLDAAPAALVGHSMGGKVAMRLALDIPEAVSRLLVADIAPVVYPPRDFHHYVATLQALELKPGLTRVEADAALRAAVPDAGVRAFLLQNLRVGAAPEWRIALAPIAAHLRDLEGWEPGRPGERYDGPTLFVTGANSKYVRTADHPAIHALFPAVRFAAVPDAGHWLHADNPAAFVALVTEFLA